jgi:hypothetical protein
MRARDQLGQSRGAARDLQEGDVGWIRVARQGGAVAIQPGEGRELLGLAHHDHLAQIGSTVAQLPGEHPIVEPSGPRSAQT